MRGVGLDKLSRQWELEVKTVGHVPFSVPREGLSGEDVSW